MDTTHVATSTERHDLVIVGGGAAGLAAASTLVAAGVDVVLLEARHRWGGRLRTVYEGDGQDPLELGAEFVHGDAPRTSALAADAGIDLVEGEILARWHRDDKIEDAPEWGRAQHDAFEAALRVVEHGPDRSFKEALDASGAKAPGREFALGFVEGFQAADPARISTLALTRGDLDRLRRVPAGYDRLVAQLVGRIPPDRAHLGHEVQHVRWSRGDVEVLASASAGVAGEPPRLRAFRASKVLLALPLEVLRDLPCEPPLDAKAAALAGLATGHVLRITMTFREPLWAARVPPPALVRCPGSPFPVFWTGSRPESTRLVAWAGGPRAFALASAHDVAPAERALEQVGRVLGLSRTALERAFTGGVFHDWDRDPFARGGYSYPLVGGADAGVELAEPLDGTVFFAGEAVAPLPLNGTVEGALESGYRAAERVLGRAAH